MAFGKRPAEELYKVADDPYNLKNIAADPAMTEIKTALAGRLDEHLRSTEDPRATGNAAIFDEIMHRYPVLGSNLWGSASPGLFVICVPSGVRPSPEPGWAAGGTAAEYRSYSRAEESPPAAAAPTWTP